MTWKPGKYIKELKPDKIPKKPAIRVENKYFDLRVYQIDYRPKGEELEVKLWFVDDDGIKMDKSETVLVDSIGIEAEEVRLFEDSYISVKFTNLNFDEHNYEAVITDGSLFLRD